MRVNRQVATRLIQAAIKAAWDAPKSPEIEEVRCCLLDLLGIVDAPAVPMRTVEDDLEEVFTEMTAKVRTLLDLRARKKSRRKR